MQLQSVRRAMWALPGEHGFLPGYGSNVCAQAAALDQAHWKL